MTTELPDECDFCERALDEDEDLVPVFVGTPEQPKSFAATGTAEKLPDVVAYRSNNMDDVQVLGHSVDELSALLSAIQNDDRFEIDVCQSVDMAGVVGGDPVMMEVPVSDKVGVRLKACPREIHHVPDMELCSFCAESFSRD